MGGLIGVQVFVRPTLRVR